MKKHGKRTALMFPGSTTQAANHPILSALSPLAPRTFHGLTLPHMLVVLLTETLLPIIPSIDGASYITVTYPDLDSVAPPPTNRLYLFNLYLYCVYPYSTEM